MNFKSVIKMFVCSLHTHVKSIFDADIAAKALCEKIVFLGGKGCAITDHGVLSSIEDYRRVFSDYGLKLIPGVEIYVDGKLLGRLHLVLLAVNDNGYKGICKIVTDSNRNLEGGYPVVTKEILEARLAEYKGDIIALSACIQGVISAVFLLNSKIEKEIKKIQNKQEKYTNPASIEYLDAEKAVEEAQEALDKALLYRDEIKATAEQKFAQREKAVAKSGDEEAKLQLEADKIDAQKAKAELPEAKNAAEKAKKQLSAAKKALKEMTVSVDKFLFYEEEIISLRKELKTDDELEQLAEKEMKWYSDLFGKDNFYAEVQNHGIEEEAICFPKVAKLAKKAGIKLVATNDVHILENNEDERLKRQVLRSLRFGTSFEEESIGDSELYLKDNYELAESLANILDDSDIIEAINNIEVIFDRCNVEFKTGKHYPKFADNSEEVFDKAIKDGIKWRFPEGMDREHELRLEREIEVIKSMGYVDYHLVVKDFLEYGRLLGYVPKNKLKEAPLTINELKEYIELNGWKNGGMLIGPGRGSAVGSLVCYLLGIVALDPIKYGLLFERFLNPERISMPDIDSDISATTRPKVIEYVQNKYGYNAVCGIMTTNAQAPRGSINIAAKFYGLKYYGKAMTNLGRQIAKDVTAEVGVSFASKVAENGVLDDKGINLVSYLNKKYEGNRDALEIIKWATIIEGSFTAYGAHAAGIVISDNDDISEYLPLKMNTVLGMMTTQCDKEKVEENGLLKFDFLGLQTLDIITESIRMIEENHGIIIDPLKIDLEDSNVFELMSQGKTNSVFQFESAGMKSMLKRFKPERFEDLIILVSMFRPGPLQYLNDVIDVKNGKKPMTFLCPQLESIIGKTYGAIVYQEQVMEICQKLGGFTLGHADEVRRYMSKKKADKLAHEREAFVEGCAKNEISSEIANQLFDQMMDFAAYAFNKSHAAAYAYNAYITAWLKCYYAPEFFAAALNWTTTKKLSGLMYEAKKCGVEVLAPDINLSEKEFSVKEGVIRFGLSSVAGVKDNADEILEERLNGSFTSLKNFLERCNSNSRVVENLIDAGAFDYFSKNRLAMKALAVKVGEILPNIKKKTSFVDSALLVLPIVEKSSVEEIRDKQTRNGLKVEITEPTTIDKLQKRVDNAKSALEKLTEELGYIKEPIIEEDKTARLNKEKSLLGIYVSDNPLNYYPSAEDIACKVIEEIEEDSTVAYGVISNLEIKARKSDGASMAFFELEDVSGSIQCMCFTKAYARCAETLKEGVVVKLFGKVIVEEGYGEEEDVYKFVVEEVESIQPKKSTFFMSVSSYASFYIDAEECFIEEYSCEDGHELIIYDKALDEMRNVPYKVSEKVLELPCCREIH